MPTPAGNAEHDIETTALLSGSTVDTQDVFVVHGRDTSARDAVCRVIRQLTDREPIILNEQPNKGRTVIEKFEDHAGQVGAAVVIVSPDDEGRLRHHEPEAVLTPRTRQNVLFELGWFYAKLGRDRVIALLVDDVEWPSDIHGVVYERLDTSGGWKHRLGKELAAAGIDVDLNNIQ
ncbi:MAG TPA: nucleotide-binding protein [Jiangellaceae bacterium]|nr:nucleotide-binding protein [Jiangellaceae bacterium]